MSKQFHIGFNSKEPTTRHDPRSLNNFIVAILGIAIFLVGLFITLMFANSVRAQSSREFQDQLDRQVGDTSTYMQTRIESYNRLLLASATIFNVKGVFSRNEWAHFYESMKVEKEYPSAIAVGYLAVLKKGETASFEDQVRAEGFTDFTITPKEQERDTYAVITYIEPFNELNKKAFGYDMFSETSRRYALEQARDTGEPTMTPPLVLVQDSDSISPDLGVLIYYPVYRGGEVPTTVEARRAAIVGFTYAALHPSDVLQRYLMRLTTEATQADIALFDTSYPDKALLTYDGTQASEQVKAVGQKTFEVAGHPWLLTISAAQPFGKRVLTPLGVILLGGIISLLLAFGVIVGLSGRFRKVEQTYRKEVQRTKDELLALASHQLRTPASGVKQYVGMLAEGLVGELTPLQKEIAEKAYEANERQLHIINELLYVSKADAGQLLIEPTEINLTPFVGRIVESFTEQAAKKRITLDFHDERPYTVAADDRYIGMVIENLVSNAIKYSYPDSEVTIVLGENESSCFVAVTDRGVGIDKKDFARVFTKFDRIQNPLSHSESGSGLGLFLAQQLAKGHGGKIVLTSTPKKGSTFTLYLPKKSSLRSVTVSLDGRKTKHNNKVK